MKFSNTTLGHFNQLLDVLMLDYDDIVGLVSESYRQVKMDGYLWPVGFVDHRVVAHSTNKWNIVPVSKNAVTKMVFWLVAFFVEVVS